MPTTTTTTTDAAGWQISRCTRCNEVARLTQAGWRHGWPPAGHDGHCVGTGFYPTV